MIILPFHVVTINKPGKGTHTKIEGRSILYIAVYFVKIRVPEKGGWYYINMVTLSKVINAVSDMTAL